MTRALLAALLLAAPAWAQGPSHQPLPGADDADYGKLLRQRFQLRKQGEKAAADLMKDLKETFGRLGLDPAKLRGLEGNSLLQDPNIQEALRGLLDTAKGGQGGVTPEGLEKLQEQLKNLGGVRTPADLKKLTDQLKPKPPGGQQGTPPQQKQGADAPRSPPEPPTQKFGTPVPDPADQKAVESFNQWFRQLARNTNQLPEALRDSPTLKKLLGELTKPGPEGVRGETLAKQLARWREFAKGFREAVGPLKFKLPQWSPPSLPSVPRPGGLGRLPSVPTGFTVGRWEAACVVILLALIAVLVGSAWARSRAADAADGDIGPWPVDPARVADARQLVAAFEYLGVRECGPDARAWHHRAIADGVAGDDPARRAAAAGLADAYALARYAPGGLPDDRLDEARRGLCLLAGAGPR